MRQSAWSLRQCCSLGPRFGNNAHISDHRRRRELQKLVHTILQVILIAVLLSSPNVRANEELDELFEKDVLIIVSSMHACYLFDIYLAGDGPQRARGLMFVRDLPATTGMLFVYEVPQYISMWMKNTYIPLDMVFARADGTVSSVAEDTEPLSLRSIMAIEPVNFVLELNAGTAGRLHIDENSRLVWFPDDED